jgi:hypothetical protein
MSLLQSFDAIERRTTKSKEWYKGQGPSFENLNILKAQCCPRRLKVENPNPKRSIP